MIHNKLDRFAIILSAAAIALSSASNANAQRNFELEEDYAILRDLSVLTIPEAFDRAFFEHDRWYPTNRSIGRQLDSMFFSYTENEITEDAELVYVLYEDIMQQQTTNDPFLRTPDLPNPFNETLLTTPSYNPTEPVFIDRSFDERLFP